LPAGEAYNPENQYLQIWLEYGIFWFAWRMYLYLWLHVIGRKAYKLEQDEHHKLMKKTRQYGMIIFALSLWLFGLTIEWIFLHSFVDRMIVYPFMAIFGLAYALYLKSLTNKHT
jgi:O-antigen ligase